MNLFAPFTNKQHPFNLEQKIMTHWHRGVGAEINSDMTIDEQLQAANQDWKVETTDISKLILNQDKLTLNLDRLTRSVERLAQIQLAQSRDIAHLTDYLAREN